MKKHVKKHLYWLLLVCGTINAITDQFLPPIDTIRTIHYPLPTRGKKGKPDTSLLVDTWTGFTIRTGDSAFFDEECPDKVTRNIEPITSLFFGKSEFFVEEAFPGGQIDPTERPVGFPAVSLARIKPLFKFTDTGAFFAGRIFKQLGHNNQWRIGGRTTLMVRSVGGIRPGVINFPIGDVVARRQEDIGETVNANAYRLDYASLLANPNTKQPMVIYGTNTPSPTLINGVNIGGHVDVKRSQDERASSVATPYAQAPSGTALNAGGTNGSDGDRLGFVTGTNYRTNLGQDRDAQQKLFLVPNTDGTELDSVALEAQNAIDNAINFIDNNGFDEPEQYLRTQGVTFETESDTIYGMSDWEWVLLGSYNTRKWYVQFGGGLKIPTGRTVHCPGDLLVLPIDTNGHVTVLGEFEIGYHPKKWWAVRMGAQGSHICSHTERRAAPFEGATIKNIGPAMDITTSWSAFVANIDATIYNPSSPNLGVSAGYEFFMRGLTHASAKEEKVRDFRGLLKPVDMEVIEARTNALSHKLRAEVFFSMGRGEFFAGVSRVLAGRNALRETQANVGFTIKY